MRRVAALLVGLTVSMAASAMPQGSVVGAVEFSSNLVALNEGFAWAKATALGYAFEGDPVGKWYEAALPGRAAFCMRDVSHQIHGGLALGLGEHTENMLRKFALNIAASRQWTSFWEIDRLDRPAPVDYRSDEDFWYNLPANFDVVDAAWRTFEWTGNRAYLDDPDFDAFYRHSLTSYVTAWDPNGDGLMESPESNGYRGIPTYWEGGGPRALTGADLVAAQYAANNAYANVLRSRGDDTAAMPFAAEARRLRALYNDDWWNPDTNRFYTAIVQDGSFDPSGLATGQVYPLYFGIVKPGARRAGVVEGLPAGENVELNSYMAEVYYKNGRPERAFDYLMSQLDPELHRREYPENPFSAIGTIAYHLMGVKPRASEGVIETAAQLPVGVEWAEIEDLPMLGGQITVRHHGSRFYPRTSFTNKGAAAVRWRAVFRGELPCLDGEPGGKAPQSLAAESRVTQWGGTESYVELAVAPGETATVGAPNWCPGS